MIIKTKVCKQYEETTQTRAWKKVPRIFIFNHLDLPQLKYTQLNENVCNISFFFRLRNSIVKLMFFYHFCTPDIWILSSMKKAPFHSISFNNCTGEVERNRNKRELLNDLFTAWHEKKWQIRRKIRWHWNTWRWQNNFSDIVTSHINWATDIVFFLFSFIS